MALTNVEIVSRALTRLGAKSIQSFDEGSDVAASASLVYTSILESELSVYPWRFAMKKAQLNQLTDTPTNEWKYAYQLPTDRIGAPFAVFDTSAIGDRTFKQFEVFADKIYANVNQLYIDYPFKPSETAFPAYFTEFLVVALAANLAVPITDQVGMADMYRGLAYGTPSEGGNGGMLARARRADAAQQPPQGFTDFSLVDERF